jgi:hypothetical protein
MHSLYLVLLVAKLDDWIKIVPVFLFLIFWVMGQIAEAKKKARASKTGPPPVPPSQMKLPAVANQPAAQVDPLRQQVDEFLRRAGRQPAAPPADAAAGAATPKPMARPAAADRDRIEILIGDEPTSTNRPPQSQRQPIVAATRPAPAPPRPQKSPRPARVTAPRPKSVAEHVAEHVTSAVRQISDEASRLGERVAAVDKQFDAQLQQKFDHEIGTLGDRRAAGEPDQPPPAEAASDPLGQIATLLASADGMRQAVLLNEILRRPEERW